MTGAAVTLDKDMVTANHGSQSRAVFKFDEDYL